MPRLNAGTLLEPARLRSITRYSSGRRLSRTPPIRSNRCGLSARTTLLGLSSKDPGFSAGQGPNDILFRWSERRPSCFHACRGTWPRDPYLGERQGRSLRLEISSIAKHNPPKCLIDRPRRPRFRHRDRWRVSGHGFPPIRLARYRPRPALVDTNRVSSP